MRAEESCNGLCVPFAIANNIGLFEHFKERMFHSKSFCQAVEWPIVSTVGLELSEGRNKKGSGGVSNVVEAMSTVTLAVTFEHSLFEQTSPWDRADGLQQLRGAHRY